MALNEREILGGKAIMFQNDFEIWQFRCWISEEKAYVRKSLKTKDEHFLINAAMEYQKIANEIAEEVANRSMKANLANQKVKEMLYKIVADINEHQHPSAPPIFIGF